MITFNVGSALTHTRRLAHLRVRRDNMRVAGVADDRAFPQSRAKLDETRSVAPISFSEEGGSVQSAFSRVHASCRFNSDQFNGFPE